jgi:hypothetical protein
MTQETSFLSDQRGDAMSDENGLHWYALNYRTAHTLHAEAAWKELEAFVAAAILAERERCAKLCEDLDHGAFGSPSFIDGVQIGSIGCANAIRKGTQ